MTGEIRASEVTDTPCRRSESRNAPTNHSTGPPPAWPTRSAVEKNTPVSSYLTLITNWGSDQGLGKSLTPTVDCRRSDHSIDAVVAALTARARQGVRGAPTALPSTKSRVRS